MSDGPATDEPITDAPITDAQLGAALRALSTAAKPGSFEYYAAMLVRWGSDPEWLARFAADRPERIKVMVRPDRSGGVFEHLCEMVSAEVPTGAIDPFSTRDIADRIGDLAIDLREEEHSLTGSEARRAKIEGKVEGLAWVLARAMLPGQPEPETPQG